MFHSTENALQETEKHAKKIVAQHLEYGENLRSMYSKEALVMVKQVVRFNDNIRDICMAAKTCEVWAKDARALGRESFSPEEMDLLAEHVDILSILMTEQTINFDIIADDDEGITLKGLTSNKESAEQMQRAAKYLKKVSA